MKHEPQRASSGSEEIATLVRKLSNSLRMNATPIRDAFEAGYGQERAEKLFARLDNYSNQPNAVKGAAKRLSDPEVEEIARAAFAAATHEEIDTELDEVGMWGLLTLAARADITILDLLPEDRKDDRKVAAIRRAVATHVKTLGTPSVSASPQLLAEPAIQLPTTVSKVDSWLKDNPDADPTWFAPSKGQKAAARRVALRALTALATPAAFDVITNSAKDEYPANELDELHRAWAVYDRRAFSAAMFSPDTYLLRLGVCSDLTGIGAVAGLRGLEVILDAPTDLTPLAECRDLERLHILVTDDVEVAGLECLAQLPRLAELHLARNAGSMDLEPLADTAVERLDVTLGGGAGDFLQRMPELRRLLIAGEATNPHRPANRDLPATLLALAADGVEVVTYKHEKTVSEPLATLAAAADGISVCDVAGRIGLTKNPDGGERLRSRMFSNILP